MIPKLYHLTTKDGSLNSKEDIIFKRNINWLGPDWTATIYSDEDNVKIIRENYPEFLDRYLSINKGVMKADIMRCIYMHLYGGIYSDTDFQFLRPLSSNILNTKCMIPAENDSNEGFKLCNCLFFSEPNNSFWYDFVENILNKAGFVKISEPEIIPISGPIGITKFYLDNKEKYINIEVCKPITFFPISHRYSFFTKLSQETYGIHYCLASWRNLPWYRRIAMRVVQNLQIRGWNFR